ncbi:indole-3-glycerol phosphate synthase [Compostibacillus humi]|uniref:Indole-3-glycerol phosphate synthase n=1 Tax=Compostibacillus humi TaxID=1245525 RepID=A0A8J2ZRA6_9BACI|nr:indole-3-glycerol phosphate synthase TrpC [Compostibacillus humi]GGH72422.1 indole-3-glycerol phosphate synthase [Compostibacillus humi]
MSILEKILAEKQREIALFQKQQWEVVKEKQVPSFTEQVRKAETISIIAEIKRASPSKGEINSKVDPVFQAKQYEKSGAAAISVLTDSAFFQGSMEDLEKVREAVSLPILCKDFIIDPIQIDRAKAAGANMILLIAAALKDTQLTSLFTYAKKEHLEVLVEVHNEEEMKRAMKLNPFLIGINNRNLKTFAVDLQTTERLASYVTNNNSILVSESGIKSRDDVYRLRNAGAKAILVGETLMQAENLKQTFQDLQVPLAKEGIGPGCS